MTMNFKHHVIKYDIYIVTLCGRKQQNWKNKIKIPVKDKWKTPAIVPLMQIVAVNNSKHLIHITKLMVHCYTTNKTVIQFTIGYMINPQPKFNNVFITNVEKC